MKKLLIKTLFLLLVSSLGVLAQSYEGTFMMQIMDDGSISQMIFSVKGDKLLIEPVDPSLPRPVKVFMQKGSDDLYVLTEQQGVKVAVKNSFVVPQEEKTLSDKSKFSVTETGKKKTISTYECRQVIVDNGEGQKLEMWVTDAMGFTLAQLFENIGRFSSALNQGDYLEVTKNNHQELYQKNMALEINDLTEGSSTQILIKDVKRQTLSSELFDIKGYQILDMNKMMGK